MQRDFLEVGILVFGVTFLLLDSAVWSGWTHFKEYPPCRLATLLQPLYLHGKSLTECAAVCSPLSDCATVSYHGHSHSCELAARDAFLDGCSDTADTTGWRTFGRKGTIISDSIGSKKVIENDTVKANIYIFKKKGLGTKNKNVTV